METKCPAELCKGVSELGTRVRIAAEMQTARSARWGMWLDGRGTIFRHSCSTDFIRGKTGDPKGDCIPMLGDAVAKRASPGMPKPNVCPRRSGNSEKPAYAKPIVAGEMRRMLLLVDLIPPQNLSEANWTGPRGTKEKNSTNESHNEEEQKQYHK
ncbi:hypothetical protein ASPTUDRAFT_56131 [Aspergillus tubingensis CBS 134.48]|uniref:Uncharacterized protein n=1 Tax=Aspergillus tubingensis (strain CBS 134.48) TaxID=767770 RepID=A0A1L9N4Z3_ASPTC|nr:hypothetical protein ASPTUDRAFT_56131 [Aspergillus tubingensis CBS 134.48]